MRNITNKTLSTFGSVHIDDWGYVKQSEILECDVSHRKITHRIDATKIEVLPDSTMRANTDPIDIPPKETATHCWKIVEYKTHNDYVSFNFSAPTRNPSILVTISDDFEYKAGFKNSNPTEKERYADIHTLGGTYLPDQMMEVRWWPKKQPELKLAP